MADERKIDIIKKGRVFSLLDIIAIGLAVLLSVSFVAYSCATRTEGYRVSVVCAFRSGVTEYSLSEDREETIINGDDKIVITIKNGWVSVKECGCHNQVCVHTPAIRYAGQKIVCAPMGVYIKIPGPSEYSVI